MHKGLILLVWMSLIRAPLRLGIEFGCGRDLPNACERYEIDFELVQPPGRH